MAVYQGFNGSVTFNTSLIAQCQGWEVAVGMDMHEYPSLGNPWKLNAGGLAGWSGSLQCKLDYGTGQKEIIDDLIAATPTLVGAAATLTTASGDYITGTIIPNSVTIATRVNDLVTLDVQFTGTGAPTLTM